MLRSITANLVGLCWLSTSAIAQPSAYDRPTDPQRWHVIGEYSSIGVYMDKATIQRGNGRVTAWIWYASSSESETRLGIEYDRSLIRHEFDCSGRRDRVHSESFYKDGRIVASYNHDPPTTWSIWAPETDGEIIGTAVCGFRP